MFRGRTRKLRAQQFNTSHRLTRPLQVSTIRACVPYIPPCAIEIPGPLLAPRNVSPCSPKCISSILLPKPLFRPSSTRPRSGSPPFLSLLVPPYHFALQSFLVFYPRKRGRIVNSRFLRHPVARGANFGDGARRGPLTFVTLHRRAAFFAFKIEGFLSSELYLFAEGKYRKFADEKLSRKSSRNDPRRKRQAVRSLRIFLLGRTKERSVPSFYFTRIVMQRNL